MGIFNGNPGEYRESLGDDGPPPERTPVPPDEQVYLAERDRRLVEDAIKGVKVYELADRYKLSERQVGRILRETAQRVRENALEEITRAFVESKGVSVVPCGCSLRAGTVRRSIRETIADWEIEHPHLRENILSAMGNIQHGRLLDTRYLDTEEPEVDTGFVIGGSELLPVLHEV